MPSFADLKTDIAEITGYTNTEFLARRDEFIRAAEERIWYYCQHKNFHRTSTGVLTAANEYVNTPDGFLAPISLAVIVSGEHRYLDQKKENFIREVFPDPTATGVPRYYAFMDDNTVIVGPTPDDAYGLKLAHYYRPASLTAGADSGTTWLSQNAYETLKNGALYEAAVYMKLEAGIDVMGKEYEKQFLVGLEGLKNLSEIRLRKDSYRDENER